MSNVLITKKIEIIFLVSYYVFHSQHKLYVMSAFITSPATADESIRACCADKVAATVAALAAKYHFDAEEAECSINLVSTADESIRGCCADMVAVTVAALAAKYHFDAEEAECALNLVPAPKKSVTKAAECARDAAARAAATCALM